MKTGRPKRKISEERNQRGYQFKICLWIAMGKTDIQIIQLLKDRMDVNMSVSNIRKNYRYKKSWSPIIEYLRKRYLNNISRIPIANKGVRLHILQEAIEEALTWYLKSYGPKGKKIMEKKIGIVSQLINEARKEVEGEKPFINVNNVKQVFSNIKIEGKTQSELIEDVAKRLAYQHEGRKS